MTIHLPLRNREEAGQLLADRLSAWRQQPDVIVLALPRGGVPVAAVIARELQVRLDLMLVRKLGVPGSEELAMGAIASGGVQVMNPHVVDALQVPPAAIAAEVLREQRELERRERACRGPRPAPVLRGQRVILVDDGLATGATLRAAVEAVRQQSPAVVIAAVPLGAPDSVDRVGRLVDVMVCPFTPEPFAAIGEWYEDFGQVSDADVQRLLQAAWAREAATGGPA